MTIDQTVAGGIEQAEVLGVLPVLEDDIFGLHLEASGRVDSVKHSSLYRDADDIGVADGEPTDEYRASVVRHLKVVDTLAQHRDVLLNRNLSDSVSVDDVAELPHEIVRHHQEGWQVDALRLALVGSQDELRELESYNEQQLRSIRFKSFLGYAALGTGFGVAIGIGLNEVSDGRYTPGAAIAGMFAVSIGAIVDNISSSAQQKPQDVSSVTESTMDEMNRRIDTVSRALQSLGAEDSDNPTN